MKSQSYVFSKYRVLTAHATVELVIRLHKVGLFPVTSQAQSHTGEVWTPGQGSAGQGILGLPPTVAMVERCLHGTNGRALNT